MRAGGSSRKRTANGYRSVQMLQLRLDMPVRLGVESGQAVSWKGLAYAAIVEQPVGAGALKPIQRRQCMTLTNFLVPTFTQMLKTLSSWLKKAQEQMPIAEVEALLSARLASDMFPLSTQVRFACLQAQEAVSRLREQPFPKSVAGLLEEGRNASERPGSLSDAQARIDETLALLESLALDALDVDPDKLIEHKLPNGMIST